MFGLLSPARRDAAFCRTYTHLCQTHRQAAGLPLLGFHSYESVLLYLLAADAQLVTLDDKPLRTCCQLQPPPVLPAADERISRFCSHFSTLLAHIKLTDDVHDDSSARARFILWLMSGRFAAAHQFFTQLDSQFPTRVAAILASHANLEKSATTHDLHAYATPTADGFGYLFSLLAQLSSRAELAATFHAIGAATGRAIIAFDLAQDFPEDCRTGAYNALPGAAHIPIAYEYAQQALRDAATVAETAFGAESLAARHLHSVSQSFALDEHGAVTQAPGVLDEAVAQQCVPQKAFGIIPLPFLAQSSSHSSNDSGACVMGIVALGACMCINSATRDSCLGRTEGRRDSCGNVTVERKGCCE